MKSSGSGCRICCKMPSINCCNNIQTITFRDLTEELKNQFKYIWSSILFNITIFTVTFIPLLFSGRLGDLEFASVSLAISMINILCISVANGMATACDTFFSQMYGSSNRKNIGIVLQRSILVLNLFSFTVLAIIPNMESILILVNVKPEIARLSGIFIIHFMPAVPIVFTCNIFIKYLQNTNHLLPALFCTLTSNLMSALLCYVFVYQIEMGIRGPAIAMVLSFYVLLFLLLGYIYFSKMYIETWHGWNRECMYEWGAFSSLSISGMLHVCLEWWGFEIGYFMAGILGKTQLGAFSVTIQVAAFAYMVPLGLAIAASIRIGHALGAKNPKGAKLAIYVALICSWLCAIFVYGTVFGTRNHIAKIFIDDPEIIKIVAAAVPLCATYGFFDFTGAVCNGGLRGSGHQKLGATINLICFYVICIPVGGSLMFLSDLGVVGLWTGIMIGIIIQGITLFLIMMNLDWDKEVQKAQIRAGVKRRKCPDNSMQDADPSERERLKQSSEGTTEEEDATELSNLSKLKQHPTDLEKNKSHTVMDTERTNEDAINSRNMEKDTDNDIRLVRGDMRHVVFKRVLFLLISILIFIVGLMLSIVFRPTYCDFHDAVNATVHTDYAYSYDEDCIEL